MFAVFSNFGQFQLESFFSSDTLYLPSIYKDVFTDGHSLEGWHLNPSPNFFPDMVLYFLLMGVSANFITASFIFALIQYVFILYLFTKLFNELFPNRSKHWYTPIYVLFSVFLLEYLFFTKDFSYSFFLISNSYHTGSFVMSLVCFLFSVRYYKYFTLKYLLLLFVLGVLCIVSDRLFIILYTVPVIVSSFFLIRHIKLKHIVLLWLTSILSLVAGLAWFKVIGSGNYIYFDEPHKMIAFNDIKSSYDIFSGQILAYAGEAGFKSFSIYLFMFSFIGMAFLFFYTRRTNNLLLYFYSVFSIVYSIVVLAAPIINGNYSGVDTLRYNIYPFYLGPLNSIILAAFMVKNNSFLKNMKYVAGLAGVSLLAVGLYFTNGTGLRAYFNYYPETVQWLDNIAEEKGLLCGAGNYWDAKKTTLFSKKGVKLYAVFDDMALYEHVANQNWFYNHTFNFILLNKFRDTVSYQKSILTHEVIEEEKDIILVKTNTFTYKKDKGYLPVNTLTPQ